MNSDSITYFGPIRVAGLPIEALDFVDGALDAIAYVEETRYAPPAADDALAPDEDQLVAEAAIAAEVWS